MSTFYSRKAIQPQTPDSHLWKNMVQFVFNPLNYTNIQLSFACGVKQMVLVILGAQFLLETEGKKNNSNKAEKTQIAIVIITIIAASIKMKYSSV